VREASRKAHAPGEVRSPLLHVTSLNLAPMPLAALIAPECSAGTGEPIAEQPRRLQRHADALADDGMDLARGIADEKGAPAPESHSRPQRPCRKPGPDPRGAGQSLSHSTALAAQERLNDITGFGTRAGLLVPAGAESVTPDAAGDRGQSLTREDHAAIPAGT
jgi:hypothetical protein